ncbi:MAG: hypothetical protein ACHQ4G_02215 [Opitutales bacterium]
MQDPFILFWAILIFSSIFWYGFLVLFIGIRAGRELRDLIKSLRTNRPGPGNGA